MLKESETSPVQNAGYTGELAIQANSLSKTYSEGLFFKKRFEALKDVSFNVNSGEIFGLLGPNGAGKTTFIKILLGIIRKTGGAATMMGQNAGSRAGRRLVGYLPEHLRIPPHLNGYTALECYGSLSNVPKSVIVEKRNYLLDLVGLKGREKDRCKNYSKGMLQRLGLAQSLLHEPKLLILDEPTDGLDPQARADMRQVIRRLKDDGVTIFLNSHILQEVEMICDRVAILNRGELKYCGAVSDIGDFVKEMAGSADAGLMVEVEVKGSPDSINAGFDGKKFEILTKEAGQFAVRATLPGQDDVDQLIDSLRQNGVSILAMSRAQVTLEDAFLKIISDASSQPSVDSRLDSFRQ
ncbi:MAG: ABC-2 type transport system ATP-binding protein [Mariniblastus sp.]|jgi:ABC-2 type transport system ATP-binding protein